MTKQPHFDGSPCDLDATTARRLIGQKALSPVELVQSCIERIEAVDHAVNAVVTRDFDKALSTARRMEDEVMSGAPLGPLHGLPIGIKDTAETGGLRTTFGSVVFRDHMPQKDEGFVARLRDAGGVVIGKTNVPEWAAGGNTRNPVFGATGNPFDTTKTAAGSSGGSAAALACGMMPLASGSDTGGSLRNPAAYCGIVGFRPTPGLIPSEKRGTAWLQVSTLGPMARTVQDTALMLSVMAGRDGRDPLSPVWDDTPYSSADWAAGPPAVDLSQLKVAVTTDFGFAPVETAIAGALKDKVARFADLFGSVTEATPDCSGADDIFAVLRAVAALSMFEKMIEKHGDQIGPNIHANVAEGLGYSASDVSRALNEQTAYHRRWHAFFGDYDIVLAPAVTVSPRSWRELYPREIEGRETRSYYHWLACAYATTIAGCPALSLPVGVDHHGMPFGLQIVARRGADRFLLGVAHALESALAGDPLTARPLPKLDALTNASPLNLSEGFYSWD
ncbi:amidase family protein [Agrobacterium sp. BA1120]|uniref:amidase n=1 Tax=Agrobacterium sp. BA1120 TaxID=3228927 RepID=UPI003369EDB1